MPKEKIRERHHRLSLDCYRGRVRVVFTMCLKRKTPIFQDEKTCDMFLKFLKQASEKHRAKNWAYVFMPDHFHFILEGESEDSNLWKATVLFKQLTGFWLLRNHPEVKWQKDFYDHVLRQDDELRKHIYYILENPVRQRLVTDWRDYLYKGALHEDLEDIL